MPILMIEMEQRHHSEPIWDLIKEIENNSIYMIFDSYRF